MTRSLIILCLLFTNSILAQHYQVEQIGTTEGLSQSSVWSIMQDSLGFMWFGTDRGLNKFDGYTFTAYSSDEKNTRSISDNFVRALYLDSKSTLWVGTQNGALHTFHPETESFNTRSSISAYSITEDRDKNVWVGSIRNGLINLTSNQTYTHVPENISSLSGNSVRSLYSDLSGNLWVGTFDNGLNKYEQRSQTFTKVQLPLNNEVRSIYQDSKHRLWVGTMDGIAQKTTEGFKKEHIDTEATVSVVAITETSRGELILGTFGHGLFIYNEQNQQFIPMVEENEHLSDLKLLSLYEDKDETLWVGTISAGVNKLTRRSKRFYHYKHKPKQQTSLSNNSIFSIEEISSNEIWIATHGGGINIFHPNSHTFSVPNITLSSTKPTYILKTTLGSVWIGTMDQGLYVYYPNTKTTRRYSTQNGLSHNTIVTLYEDSEQMIWIGTYGGGLTKLNPTTDQLTHYTHLKADSTSLSDNIIYAIGEDSYKTLWVGTGNGGLSMYNKKNGVFHQFQSEKNLPTSLSHNNVFSIYADKKKQLWIGTANGLNRFDYQKKLFKRYTKKDGLNCDIVYGILEDDVGTLWLSTNNGLFSFHINENRFIQYDVSDGLQGKEFGPGAYMQTRNGEMYFGGQNGLNRFHPKEIRVSLLQPKIVLTDFQIYNKSIKTFSEHSSLSQHISYAKQVILNPDQNMFSIEFTSLDYTHPKQNKYAYMLEGFNNEWIHTHSERRYATYTNLNPGTYTFKVKGTNHDGVWSVQSASIQIYVRPPFWNTTWFKLSLISFCIALLIGFYQFRVRSIRKRNTYLQNEIRRATLEIKSQKDIVEEAKEELEKIDQLKTRFFTNISHEYRTPLTLILGPIQQLVAKTKEPNTKETLSLIYKNATRLYQLTNQILDLSKIESGKMTLNKKICNLSELCTELCRLFTHQKSDQVHFSVDIDANVCLEMDQVYIEQMILNLLSNAFKYTQKGHVHVSLKCVEGIAYLNVSDSGIGIRTKDKERIFERYFQVSQDVSAGTGIGLSFVKEIVELHEGTISVASEETKGTTFSVQFPFAFIDADIHSYPSHRDDFKPSKKQKKIKPKQEKESTVLIVEDNPDVLLYISDILEPIFNIHTAENGVLAERYAIKKLPDIIISDVMMPEMDGFELASRLKKNPITSHIPLILLTAKAEHEDKLHGLGVGIDDYITKPFHADELFQRAQNLIDQRNMLREKYSKELVVKPKMVSVTRPDERFVNQFQEYIETHIEDGKLTVEQVSDALCMNKKQLERKTKAILGKSPNQFIREYRLSRAKQLLSDNGGTVSEIAYAVGYNSVSYFTKSFKEFFNKLPTEFINK